METIRQRTDKVGKYHLVLATMRSWIISGQLHPGERFPSRLVLQRELGATTRVLQSVINQLVADGFLVTRDREGTFVTLTPPHLDTYGIIFAGNPLSRPPDGTFESMLAYEALQLQQAGAYRIKLYFNITGHADDVDFQCAVDDVNNHRLTGVFIIGDSRRLTATPLLTAPHIGRVTIDHHFPGVPAIHIDTLSFIDTAFGYLAARQRRNIIIVGMTTVEAEVGAVRDALQRHDLKTTPRQEISFSVSDRRNMRWLRHYITMLMENAPLARPDGIVITDDYCNAEVLSGLIDAGVTIGGDVEIVAHANFPLLQPDLFPITRLGLPIPQLLAQVFQLIDRQQQGEQIAETFDTQFLFAHDLLSDIPVSQRMLIPA